MTRDHRKLRAFTDADALVIELYELTGPMPMAERFGLQSQLRRAGVSVPTNIVEGSGRHSTAEYCRFLEIAQSSARECEYLLDVSARLTFVDQAKAKELGTRYNQLAATLLAVTRTLAGRRP